MMKGNRIFALFFATSMGLVGLSILAAILSVAKEGFGAIGAAWVQAGGSIAAITGAIWLFRSEAILRRRERRALSEELAWAVRFALTNAQLETRTIAAELFDKHLVEQESPRRHWFLRTENCQNVLRVFAQRTDHIHPALNHIASNGMLLLRQFDEDIARALDFVERGEQPPMGVAGDVARYSGHFEVLLQELDARMRGILQALDEGGDYFPTKHLEMWKVPADK